MDKHEKLLSIIVLTYFSESEIRDCLNALVSAEDERVEILVIDNASRDNTVSILEKEYAHYPSIRFILNSENIGFAKGNNQGVAQSKGEYVLILNPDTIAPLHKIFELVTYMEKHSDIGVLGPRIVDEYGTVQESYGKDITPWNEFVGKFLYSKYAEIFPFIKKIKERKLNSKQVTNVGWIGGACALFPRELYLEIGGIDPQFFLSHGDMVDMGKKIKMKGYNAVLYPQVEIIHTGSKSVAHNRDESLRASYIGTLHVFRKYYGSGTVLLAKIVYFVSSLVKSCIAFPISLIRKEPFRAIAYAHFKNAMRIISGKLGNYS